MNNRVQKLAKLEVADAAYSETAKIAIAVSASILGADWTKLDSLLADTFTYTGDGYHFSKDEYIGFMQDMRASFSDFHMVLEKIITEANYCSIRFSSKVVNTGSFMGAPANQKDLVVTGIFQRKVAQGKVQQEWQTTDLLGTMSQIGFGATFGYAVFVTGFKVKPKPILRKPADFLNINGSADNYDKLTPSEKNKYVADYLKNWGKK